MTDTPAAPGAQIFAAISKAQSKMRSVSKDRDVEVKSEKGHYAFKYATLAAIWEVIRQPLAENGLAVVQFPTVDTAKGVVTVETRIVHASGEWLSSTCELRVAQSTPQGVGAVISYARRYGLSAMLGVTQDDENEEQALEDMRHQPPETRPPPPPPPPRQSERPPQRRLVVDPGPPFGISDGEAREVERGAAEKKAPDWNRVVDAFQGAPTTPALKDLRVKAEAKFGASPGWPEAVRAEYSMRAEALGKEGK